MSYEITRHNKNRGYMRLIVWQKALELFTLACAMVPKDRHLDFKLRSQLLDSVQSISANIAEGYSRAARKDRGRFFEYALGSAREARDWYFKARPYLGPHATHARLALLTTIIKVMIVLVSKSRPMSVVLEA